MRGGAVGQRCGHLPCQQLRQSLGQPAQRRPASGSPAQLPPLPVRLASRVPQLLLSCRPHQPNPVLLLLQVQLQALLLVQATLVMEALDRCPPLPRRFECLQALYVECMRMLGCWVFFSLGLPFCGSTPHPPASSF